MKEISDLLTEKYGFKKIFKSKHDTEVDVERFSHIRRIQEIHYLFYSELHKHFSLGVKHETPKGEAGTKGKKYWTTVTIPKVVKTVEEAEQLIQGVVDLRHLHIYF